ncbi:hypothetical protein HanHA300_Chr01g0025881 [Helianthus annuus]|nr:hypothetical protein HanHA300_Chr01g0025881 [Helianthus annuus]
MKRIWAMWHVMVEQFDEVACYGGGFRWECILLTLINYKRDPFFTWVGIFNSGHPKWILYIVFQNPRQSLHLRSASDPYSILVPVRTSIGYVQSSYYQIFFQLNSFGLIVV